MWKIWPQLLSASEPFVLVNGWNGNCFFWWPGCDDIVHPPEHLLSCFPRLQRLKPPCWRFQNFLSQAGTKIVVQKQLESKDLQSGVAIPCNTRWCVCVCVCWVCFWTNTFPTLLWRKNMFCVKIQVKMLQFPSWTDWKMQEQQTPPYVGPLEDTQYHQVEPSWWLWEKYIQSPGVFSTSAGTKGHPNKHQRGWGFCSKNTEVQTWCMSGAW